MTGEEKTQEKFSNLKLNGHFRDYGLDIIDKMGNHFSKVKKN